MASIKRVVKITGLKELDKALKELPKATGRAVLKRTLVRAGQPIAETARSLAPVETWELHDSITVSSRIKNEIGRAEYAAAMSAGLGTAMATVALRAARRAAGGRGSSAEVHVGPAQAKTKKDAIKRIVQEFGSFNQQGSPYMRPAWEAHQDEALQIVANDLGAEIAKAAQRLAAKKKP